MDQEYGYEVYPITDELISKNGTDEGICCDYDRLGLIACGLCGANEERANIGQKNFFEGLAREINK
jgi:hypothetical protein